MPLSSKIYADSLISKGYGTPLWMVSTDVMTGDVGFVHDSGLWVRLFNVLYDSEHAINEDGVPEDFVPLKYSPRLLLKSPKILDPTVLASVSVKQIGLESGATV